MTALRFRSLAVVAGLLLVAALPASSQLASQLVLASKAPPAEKGTFGTFQKLLTGETFGLKDLLVGVAVIEAGQAIHPPHQHAEEEFLLLAKGEGTWHLAGKDSPAREGDLLYVAPWVMHGLENTSRAPLTFFVVKWNGQGLPVPPQPAAGAASSVDGDAPAGAATIAPRPIASAILHRADVKPDAENSPIGDVRRYWNRAATRSLRDLVTGVATLNPGQEVHPLHQHAEEEFLYVVKGSGTWSLAGKESAAGVGDLLYAQPWTPHGLKNSGADPLTFYILKWNAKALELPAAPAGAKN